MGPPDEEVHRLAGLPFDPSLQLAGQRLEEKLKERDELQKELEKINKEKEAGHKASVAGIVAAKQLMAQFRAELAILESMAASQHESQEEAASDKSQNSEGPISARRRLAAGAQKSSEADQSQGSQEGQDADDEDVIDGDKAAADIDAPFSADKVPAPQQLSPHIVEEERERRHALQLQVRALRHARARWKHQFELLSAARPKQEEEIVTLKAELTHTLDVLESTRNVVQHHVVDQQDSLTREGAKAEETGKAPLFIAGHGRVEVTAEQGIRERVEDRNLKLTTKAKKLSSIAAAQQLLIQRLEKQLLKEERELQQKDAQLQSERQEVMMLQACLRQRSDTIVMDALGFPRAKFRAISMPLAAAAADGTERSSGRSSMRTDSGGRLPVI